MFVHHRSFDLLWRAMLGSSQCHIKFALGGVWLHGGVCLFLYLLRQERVPHLLNYGSGPPWPSFARSSSSLLDANFPVKRRSCIPHSDNEWDDAQWGLLTNEMKISHCKTLRQIIFISTYYCWWPPTPTSVKAHLIVIASSLKDAHLQDDDGGGSLRQVITLFFNSTTVLDRVYPFVMVAAPITMAFLLSWFMTFELVAKLSRLLSPRNAHRRFCQWWFSAARIIFRHLTRVFYVHWTFKVPQNSVIWGHFLGPKIFRILMQRCSKVQKVDKYRCYPNWMQGLVILQLKLKTNSNWTAWWSLMQMWVCLPNPCDCVFAELLLRKIII